MATFNLTPTITNSATFNAQFIANQKNVVGICVFDGSGWIYYGILSEILSDIEAAPAYTYGTSDLTAGSSPLATGKLYLVYE